jgi:hypothetical protein
MGDAGHCRGPPRIVEVLGQGEGLLQQRGCHVVAFLVAREGAKAR